MRKARAVVVICTKDRPHELRSALCALARDRPDAAVLVVDASSDDLSQRVCADQRAIHPRLDVVHIRATRPGLARQRNEAIDMLKEQPPEFVHFLDDDTEICPGYLDAIERRLDQEPDLSGVGGIILNLKPVRRTWVRALCFLWGPPNSVTRAGRVVPGQYPGAPSADRVEWISGCCMSYRMSTFQRERFDDRLEGYSPGEDFDFGFRVSRWGCLAIEHGARCLHHVSAVNRMDAYKHARDSTALLYVWVKEQRSSGMSRPHFWLATTGDVVINLVYGAIRRDRQALGRAAGLIAATAIILRGDARR